MVFRMKHTLLHTAWILVLLAAMVLMLTHTGLVIQGAHHGLELWYSSVLPSVFPFMILTSLLRNSIQSDRICYLGLLCGLPVGANLINQQLTAGAIPVKKANVLLCICNITSPMFVCGYIWNQTLKQEISLPYFLILLYTPILLYAGLQIRVLTAPAERRKPSGIADLTASSGGNGAEPVRSDTTGSLEELLLHCIRIILMTGVYIMLFCILIQLLFEYMIHPESNTMQQPSFSADIQSGRMIQQIPAIFISNLEITNGIQILNSLPISLQQKTALIAGLTSFGGICSIFQTKSAITHSELSLHHYIILKIVFSIGTILLGLLLPIF